MNNEQEENIAWTRLWMERFPTELTMDFNEVIQEIPLTVMED